MVFFTCSYCGESVKKPSVSKHYLTKCRNKDPFLTCVDCLKDFKGNEYEAHTKCMTEDERYSAKGYVPKPSQNKGERKQQAWQECIQTVLKKPTLKQDERDLIKAISKYENVPRKKAKFVNFLNNAFKQFVNKSDLIDRVWTEMECVFKDMSANQNRAQPQQNKEDQLEPQRDSKKVSPEAEPEVKKEKKRKRRAEEGKTIETCGSEKVNDKSKKKKAKHSDENVIEGNTDMLSTNEMEDQQEKKSRKRKAVEGDKVEQNGSVADEAESEKKRKKKKHDKLAENQTTETSAQGSELVSKSKKKNKKPKSNDGEAKPNEKEITAVAAPNVKPVKKEKKSENKENKENCVEKAAEINSEKGAEAEKVVSKKKKSLSNSDTEKSGTFDWKAAILQVLNQDGKNNRIQLQKLQKKVLKLHCQILNCENSEKKVKKFMKKLKEIPQVEIDENFVVLKS